MNRNRNAMKTSRLEKCHEGIGWLGLTEVLEFGDSSLGISFMHDDLIEPGSTIGEHTHIDSEEVYFLISGSGVMIMDGMEFPFLPGDVSMVKVGHSHGLINTGYDVMRLIVFAVTEK